MAQMNFVNKPKVDEQANLDRWKVLISDDEKSVHALTETVLKDFVYKNKKIEFLNAYTGKETIEILKKHNDIALVLLDVVMETDDAGLLVAKTIREDLNNHSLQIILRTGQPGSAPENSVVIEYSINDYKEKTELTSKKLFTSIITAIRAYENMKALEASRKGLKKIIDATETIFDKSSTKLFTEGVLLQLISLLQLNHDSLLIENINGISIESKKDHYEILNSAGIYKEVSNFDKLGENVKDLINQAILKKQSMFSENEYVAYLEVDKNVSNVIYVSGSKVINELDKNLIEIFFKHASIAFNNLRLNEEMFSTQRKFIEVLGEVVEKRSQEASYHVKRVAEMSYLLAQKYKMNEEEAKVLRMVSPMHDVGKIGIPDSILLKPGKLTAEEYELMKTHTTLGHEILESTHKDSFDMAAMVAYEHHERWDGKGYPEGLKEEEISIYGRITAIIDVFDALANKRCYKEAWPLDKILDLYKEERGKQFDPNLVDLFLSNIDEFMVIQESYN